MDEKSSFNTENIQVTYKMYAYICIYMYAKSVCIKEKKILSYYNRCTIIKKSIQSTVYTCKILFQNAFLAKGHCNWAAFV